MATTGLQYFSVATNDIEATIRRYCEGLGLEQTSEVREQRWGFKGAMLGIGGQNVIEVVQPSNPESALARFMKMRAGDAYPGGEGIYLIGVRVDSIAEAVKQAKAAGLRVTLEPESPHTAWIHPASNGNVMIELSEPRPPAS
ncbi:MAG: hypothetical protein FJZ92_10135 [Chloroflexi bacterium]|nr:hypothetical protein [Chloroflexota bacterium]